MNREEYIEHLREEIKALKAANLDLQIHFDTMKAELNENESLVWNPVTKGLPEVGQECLIRIILGYYHEIEGARYIGDGDWIGAWCSTYGANKTYKVRAWAPLPKALRD